MAEKHWTPRDLAAAIAPQIKRAGARGVATNVLTTILECMYYTSLKTEESRWTRLSIVYIDPINPDPHPPQRIVRDRWQFVPFGTPVPFTVESLIKLSMASDPRSSSFAVHENDQGSLMVFGLIDQQNRYHDFLNHDSASGPERPGVFQVTVIGVGQIQVSVDYEVIAELRVDRLIAKKPRVLSHGVVWDKLIKGIGGTAARVSEFLDDSSESYDEQIIEVVARQWITSLCRLLLRTQNYRHGGAILITPDTSGQHLNVKHSIRYSRLAEAITAISAQTILNNMAWDEISSQYLETDAEELPVLLHLDEAVTRNELEEARAELDGSIWFTSLLSRVDGLVLMDPNLTVLGFGVEICATQEPCEVFIATDVDIEPASLGQIPYTHFGTRHRSMMRYCSLHPEAVGFVVSQDGDVRGMTMTDGKLIMWDSIQLQMEFKRSKKREPSESSKRKYRGGKD